MNEEYIFGKTKIELRKGEKKEGDYTLFWDGLKFTDELLFKGLSRLTKENAKKLIEAVLNYQKIEFKDDMISIEVDLDEVYTYCNGISNFSDSERIFLFSILLRIDIDNINYPPPGLNGGIRHFIQVIMLFDYLYNIGIFNDDKITDISNLTKVIYDIGFKNNQFNFETEDFFNMYYLWLIKKDKFLEELS